MRRINIREARERLSALLDAVSAGEEVVLLRRGREVARLIPPRPRGKRLPSLGSFRKEIALKGKPLSTEVARGRLEERY